MKKIITDHSNKWVRVEEGPHHITFSFDEVKTLYKRTLILQGGDMSEERQD